MRKLTLLALVLALTGSSWAANTLLPTGTADRVFDPTSDLVPEAQPPSDRMVYDYPHTDAITWVTRAIAPLQRYWGAVGSRQDTIYLAGGRMASAVSTRTMLAYIPATNTWINSGQPQTPDMPGDRRAGATGFNDTLLFYCCGRDLASTTMNTMYQFNMRTKTWSTRAACPTAAWATAGALAGNYFFRFGSEGAVDILYRFDINANTWTTLTPTPRPPGRGWHTAASAGGLFYVMGGSPGLADCWAFDPAAGTWTQRADMPGTRVYPSAIGVGDSIIVLCGGDLTGAEPADALVYVYHIAANTWTTETSMPTARGWEMMAKAAGKFYAIQGSNTTTPTYLDVNEEGTYPASGVESPEPVTRRGELALSVSPNPTRGNASIAFSLPARGVVSLKLYDAQGRLVRTLVSGTREAGAYRASLSGLSAGVYFLSLQAGTYRSTKSLVVVR